MDFSDTIQRNIKLHSFTTFGIGGYAKYFVDVKTIEEMRLAYLFAKKNNLKIFVLGKGSNILFDDKGYDGIVVRNSIRLCEYVSDSEVLVGSGESFIKLARNLSIKNLSGLEFAIAIPGSVGGAVFMNASAHGKCIADVVDRVVFVTNNGEVISYDKKDVSFDYRYSSFQKMEGAIVMIKLSLIPSIDVLSKNRSILKIRKNSQPINSKSAGCVFRNPNKEESAGYIIDKCGIKGKSIGGAMVSDIHANFIINYNNATSKDVLELVSYIKEKVFTKTKIQLESEICYVPY
jgi:UDP-N-acetylmuramate dehydrogenase